MESRTPLRTFSSSSSSRCAPKPLRRQGAFYDEDIEDLPWDRLNDVNGPEEGALPDSWANRYKAQGTQTHDPNDDVSNSRKRSRDADEDEEDVQHSGSEGEDTHPSPSKRRRTPNGSYSAASSQASPAAPAPADSSRPRRPITRSHRRPQASFLTTIVVPLVSGAFNLQ